MIEQRIQIIDTKIIDFIFSSQYIQSLLSSYVFIWLIEQIIVLQTYGITS